jgi:hypothetical protein
MTMNSGKTKKTGRMGTEGAVAVLTIPRKAKQAEVLDTAVPLQTRLTAPTMVARERNTKDASREEAMLTSEFWSLWRNNRMIML